MTIGSHPEPCRQSSLITVRIISSAGGTGASVRTNVCQQQLSVKNTELNEEGPDPPTSTAEEEALPAGLLRTWISIPSSQAGRVPIRRHSDVNKNRN